MKLLETLLSFTQEWAWVFPPRRTLNRAITLAFALITVVDGSFCNRTVWQEDWSQDNVSVVARCRKDIVLCKRAPTGYRTTKNGRTYYRQPAYRLTNDLTTPAALRLQDYFDRWGIEVNHRDEKDILGVGEAQGWNEHSVCKVPALLVALYRWLLLAGLKSYGPRRTDDYEPLPKWRRGAQRPSCLDLVTLLRKQLAQRPPHFATAESAPTDQTMVLAAAA